MLAAACVFFVLALGYYLRPGAHADTLFSRQLSLPLYWLYKAFPAIDIIAIPYRAVIGVALCLAMLASIGLAAIGSRLNKPVRYLVCALAAIGMLVETVWLSPVPFPLPVQKTAIPHVYEDLAGFDHGGAVLEVPDESHRMGAGANQRYMFYQTVHRHPLLLQDHYGPLHPMKRTRFHDGLVQAITGVEQEQPYTGGKSMLVDFCYLILHEKFIPEGRLPAVREYLDGSLDLVRVYSAEGVRLYKSRAFNSKLPEIPLQEQGRFFLNPNLATACK